jgi:phenylacetate-coenzyme A ligase PaaK-like adenylate-forming protein
MGEIKVLVELKKGRDPKEVTRALEEDLRQSFEIRIEVEAVPPQTLPRSEYKSQRFIDKRN